ncbi:MAG: diguanylate cyclase [Elusimicrobia bacterium]|nr:diguanylate cyclase [Elusimicrobiota bacterium]
MKKSDENIKKQLEDINKQLYELKREIDHLREMRHNILEREKKNIKEFVSAESSKLAELIENSLRQITDQTKNQVYRLYDEGRKVGEKIDKVAHEKVMQSAVKTISSIEKKAEKKLTKTVNRQIKKVAGKIKDDLEEAEKKAITDELTQVFNRRYFEPKLREEFRAARRQGDDISVLVLDIDDFKRVNDTYGHPAGDSVLVDMSRKISENIRREDILIRYGGEEFVIILPGMTKDKARATADRLLKCVSRHSLYWEGESFNITISIGISTYPDDTARYQELFNVADQRLLKAKKGGKNMYVDTD